MTDEFDELLEETPPEPHVVEAGDTLQVASPLVRASQIAEVDADQGDFEPGGLYKGFRMLPEHLWPADEWTPAHQLRYPARFYVESPAGTPGLVPFPGSMVVWPWERAWSMDMNRPEVESLLKPDEEKKAKKR